MSTETKEVTTTVKQSATVVERDAPKLKKASAHVKLAVCVPRGDSLAGRLKDRLEGLLVRDRIWVLDKEDGYANVITRYRNRPGMVSGTLIAFESGNAAEIVEVIEDAKLLETELFDPNQNRGEDDPRREIVSGALYFAIKEDTVLIVTSSSMRERKLESYLNWLLNPELDDQAETDDDNTEPAVSIELRDELTTDAKALIKRKGTRAVQIGSSVASIEKRVVKDDDGDDEKVVQASVIHDRRIGFKILERVFPDKVAEMLSQNLFESNEVDVFLTVRYKGSTQKRGQELIEKIASSTRNLDDEDVKITFDDESTLTGSTLKERREVRYESRKGKPLKDSLLVALETALNEMTTEGLV